ncbi:hypothetical protein TNCV_4355411 [Trichonephila clavipes]|nr:hypothetical protein TNCV_4355411 [Trichonephila clavipes]
MYKNALKEDLIRVVEDLDGTLESTDTIAKLKTKIEESGTFESDADFTAKNKALSLNPAAKTEDKQFETSIENMIQSSQTLSRPVPTRSENFNLLFQSLESTFLTKKINDEYKSEILINLLEADHVRKLQLLVDIPKTPLKIDPETINQRVEIAIPKILKDKIKIATYICGDSSHCARDCEKRFKPKESSSHTYNRKNANS